MRRRAFQRGVSTTSSPQHVDLIGDLQQGFRCARQASTLSRVASRHFEQPQRVQKRESKAFGGAIMTAQVVGSTAVPAGEGSARSVVGQFTWDTVTDIWWWSEGLYQLYGYLPSAVEPTLQRFLQHKDPRDRAQIDAVFTRCSREGGPFSCYHRIIDAHGVHKTVVAIGFGHRNGADTRTDVMQGFLVEVSSGGDRDTEEALQSVLRSRASIEQVKGSLMLVHGLTADAAFSLLRGYSQVYNRRLSAIVTAVLEAFQNRPTTAIVSRGELDRILWDSAQA